MLTIIEEENYEFKKILHLKQSNPSMLYNIEPMGLNTFYAESFSSYILRIAEAHSMRPKDLFREIVAIKTKKDFIRNILNHGGKYEFLKYINANSKISIEFIRIFEQLTGRNDLVYLTMLTWQGVLNSKILEEEKKWCPQCFEVMKSNNEIVYEPLIWFFKDINYCLKHNVELKKLCNHCHFKQPYIHAKSKVGYCPYCNNWLGNNSLLSFSISEFDKLCIENLSMLIKVAPSLHYCPTKNIIPEFLEVFSKSLKLNSYKEIAEYFNSTPENIYNWKKPRNLPNHKHLLMFSYNTKIYLFQIFLRQYESLIKVEKLTLDQSITINNTDEIYKILCDHTTDFDNNPISISELAKKYNFNYKTAARKFPEMYHTLVFKYSQYKKKRDEEKFETIKKNLQEVLGADRTPPFSLMAASEHYGFSIVTAKRHFPELCTKIVSNYKKYLGEQKRKRELKNFKIIKRAILTLHYKGVYPSRRNIDLITKQTSLFRNQLYVDYKDSLLKKLDYNRLEK